MQCGHLVASILIFDLQYGQSFSVGAAGTATSSFLREPSIFLKYSKGDKVILAGLFHKNDFDHRQQIINQLIECGINTPRLILHTTKGNHNYEVQERV